MGKIFKATRTGAGAGSHKELEQEEGETFISTDRVIEGKEKLRSVVNLLTKMIKELSEDS